MTNKNNERISNAQMAAELKRLPKLLAKEAKDRTVFAAKKAFIVTTTFLRDGIDRLKNAWQKNPY